MGVLVTDSCFLLDSVLLAEGASVLSDHAHFLAAKTSVLNSHAEQQILVLLIVGSEGVLVKHHCFRIPRAHSRKVRKLRSDSSDETGLALHALVVIHVVHENSGF